jgi:hypothetical protein
MNWANAKCSEKKSLGDTSSIHCWIGVSYRLQSPPWSVGDLHQANICYSLKSRNRHAFFEKAMEGISRELNLQIVSKGIGLGYQWTHKRLVIDWTTRLLGAICNNYNHLEANDPNFIGYQFHLRFPPEIFSMLSHMLSHVCCLISPIYPLVYPQNNMEHPWFPLCEITRG